MCAQPARAQANQPHEARRPSSTVHVVVTDRARSRGRPQQLRQIPPTNRPGARMPRGSKCALIARIVAIADGRCAPGVDRGAQLPATPASTVARSGTRRAARRRTADACARHRRGVRRRETRSHRPVRRSQIALAVEPVFARERVDLAARARIAVARQPGRAVGGEPSALPAVRRTRRRRAAELGARCASSSASLGRPPRPSAERRSRVARSIDGLRAFEQQDEPALSPVVAVDLFVEAADGDGERSVRSRARGAARARARACAPAVARPRRAAPAGAAAS